MPIIMRSKYNKTVLPALVAVAVWLWTLPLAVDAQTYDVDQTGTSNVTGLPVNISTATPDSHRHCEEEDCSGRVAGAAIGSLIAGLLLGAGVTYFALRYLESRNMRIPAKDYDTEPERFDENRNNGETAPTSDNAPAEQPLVKGHKKLERLAKTSHVGLQGDIEIPSAATPLITNVSIPASDNSTDYTSTDSSNNPDDNSSQDNTLSIYSNEGEDSRLSQPYEALEIIPEEVEYENAKCHTYEQLPPVVPPKPVKS